MHVSCKCRVCRWKGQKDLCVKQMTRWQSRSFSSAQTNSSCKMTASLFRASFCGLNRSLQRSWWEDCTKVSQKRHNRIHLISCGSLSLFLIEVYWTDFRRDIGVMQPIQSSREKVQRHPSSPSRDSFATSLSEMTKCKYKCRYDKDIRRYLK